MRRLHDENLTNMAKKRKNPFAESKNSMDSNAGIPEDMIQEFRDMEKLLGKEKFNQFLDEALQRWEDSQTGENDSLDDGYLDNLDSVTTKEWIETHPANLTCPSDGYYAELANDLCELISEFTLPANAPYNLARELGRVLAAYLEDNVSGTKVFSAMRRVCKQRYGYILPFYDCEHPDYMPDHINEEDIRFLIWKTACQLGKNKDMTYSPLAPGWALLADRIFDELNSRYEEAPEATRVSDWLRRSFRNGEYIDIREVATWLVFRNPLSYIPEFLDTIQESAGNAYVNGRIDARVLEPTVYGILASDTWQRSMSPMGCPARTLTAAMAAEFGYDALAEEIEAIEVLPKQIYAISQDKKTRKIFFETSSHKLLEVKRDSFAKGFRPDEIQYAECTLLKYKGEYLLNGVLSGDRALRTRWERQPSFLTFEQQCEQSQEWVGIMDGQQAVCVTNLKKLLGKLGFPADTGTETPEAKNFVVLFSKELGIAVLPDMGYAFDIPGNRFFRKRAAAKDSFADVVFHNAMPYDVAMYLQKNNMLPEASIAASQGKEAGLRIVQDYLAFWIGFYCELPAFGTTPMPNIDENANGEAIN